MKTYFKFQYFLLASLLFSSLLSCDSETAVEPLDFPEVDYTILPVASEELAFRSNPLYNSHGEDFKYLTLFDDAKKVELPLKLLQRIQRCYMH